MRYRHFSALPIVGLLVLSARAQVGQPGMDSAGFGNVRIHVEYPDNHAAGMHLRVQLMSGSGSTPVAENFTTDQGTAEFTRVPVGDYHVVVSGEGIRTADSGPFEVDRRKVSQSLFVTVHSSNEPDSQRVAAASPSVAAVDLNVPEAARKEFDKATKAIADQNWTKALHELNRAISLYPRYAPAYNNLGVAYGHMNDAAHERDALEKAISLNDHFVPAYVNLAKLCLKQQNSAQAETLLENVNRLEPANAETLTLLAEAQLLNKHYDAAISSAQSVHAVQHQNLAVAHYIAARAFEHENRLPEALAELQLFLKEEPAGERANHVREEITQIQHARP
jgi:Tfp pilus assembly protein PilF